MNIVWVPVILWLLEGCLPTPTCQWLEAKEVFQTQQECLRALPRFAAQAEFDFKSPGILMCTPTKSGA